jgi:GDP/UDP-N,N'-diacetylbacillosamine 2-epimerase (hydrolysing)
MKLLFVNGSRGEWGYIKPIIDKLEKNDIEYNICATNMLLLAHHGNLVKEIEGQGYNIDFKIHMSLEGGNHSAMAKSIGLFTISFVDVIMSYKPDWVILAGDRGEQLAAAVASSYSYIPTAHIQAGELSGNIDGLARHAIGKLVHLHFAANQDAADRLVKLGEEKWRVHNVGAPQLDDMSTDDRVNNNEHNMAKYYLCVYHAVTEEYDQVTKHIYDFCSAMKKEQMRRVWILPNNDAGSSLVRAEILDSMEGDEVYDNLPREEYLKFLKNCHSIVGNSSSGILEAPFYKIPAINIGNRQNGRMQAKNVINCGNTKEEIVNALRAVNEIDKNQIISIYGDGKSSDRIIDLLVKCKNDNKLLNKRMTF